MGERHRAVGLELLQGWVVEGHQVLFGAGQQLLLFVSVVLGLLAERGGAAGDEGSVAGLLRWRAEG